MTQLLETIVELQQATDGLRDAEERLQGIPEWMQELHAEHSERKAEIEQLEETIEEADRERRAAQASIEDTQSRLKRYQEQINQVTTQREYGALLHEIDSAKQTVADLEATSLDCLERREQAQIQLEERRDGFSELDRRYSGELEKWEAEKPSVARHADDLRSRITTLRDAVPRPYLAQFDRIAGRYDGQALAPVLPVQRTGKGARMWHCGACHYNARPQVVVEVGRGSSLLLCDSCKRILYLPMPGEEGDGET